MTEPIIQTQEQTLEAKEPWNWGSFVVGALCGIVVIVCLWMFSSLDYSRVVDAEGYNILMECEDGSTQWFTMPCCSHTETNKRTCPKGEPWFHRCLPKDCEDQ